MPFVVIVDIDGCHFVVCSKMIEGLTGNLREKLIAFYQFDCSVVSKFNCRPNLSNDKQ